MTYRPPRIVWVFLAAGLVFLGYNYWSYERAARAGELTLYGNVDIRQAVMGFRVSGKLMALHVEEGDSVVPGKLLAELDPEVYAKQVAQAQERVASVQARYTRATTQLARRQQLLTTQSVSPEEAESLEYEQKALEADLRQAQAQLDEAQIRLTDTQLLAVSEGTVLTRVQEPGAVVNAGQAIYTLSLPKPLWIRTFVSEPQLGLLQPGAQAEIYTDTPGGGTYKGHVGFISPVAEFTPKSVETTALRTDLVYQVRIVVPEHDGNLRQGMPVTVRISK